MKQQFSNFLAKTTLLNLAVAGAIATVSLPAAVQADITLTFGTYAADKPTETVRKFRPFLKFLEKRLSERLAEPVKIRMKISKAYDDSINQLVTGNVDFARFGPASYVTAKARNPEISIIAMESIKGEKRFKGVVAVHKDSQIKKLTELDAQTFAFGDELSTIGRYLAQSELLEAGISGENLKSFEYLGRHDLVGTAVGNQSFTAGALKESTFKKLVKKKIPIKALIKFDNVTKPWIASSRMPPKVLEEIRTLMLDPKNLDAVRSVARNGFLAGDDADYDIIRNAMERSTHF